MRNDKCDAAYFKKRLRDLLESENLNSGQCDEILNLINGYIDHSEEWENMDTDLIDAGLEKLREYNADRPQYDKEAGLAKLLNAMDRRDHGRIYKKNKILRLAGIIVAIIGILVVVANAFGINPFQYVNKLAETISFSLSPSGEMTLPPESNEEYSSLQEALDADGVDAKIPQWVPSAFTLSKIEVFASNATKSYIALFAGEDRELYIRITTFAENTINTDEKEDGGYPYEAKGRTYYIIPNTNNVKAFWTDDTNATWVSGHVTKKEMERIIDSIP